MSLMQPRARTSVRAGLRAALGATVAVALLPSLAMPALATTEERPVDPRTATVFTSQVQTNIFIGSELQPSDFKSTLDGLTGLVTTRVGAELFFVDLPSATVASSIALPAPGGDFIALSPDGASAFVVLSDYRIAVIDLATRTLRATLPLVMPNPHRLIISADSSALYMIGLSGEVAKVDPATGEVLVSAQLAGINYHSINFTAAGTELIVGGQEGMVVLSSTDLSLIRSHKLAGFHSLGDMVFDADPERLYISDSSGSRLGVVNPTTGELIASSTVGSPMARVVGSDARNRAYGNVPYWDMIMSADLATGKRSEAYRATPTAPFSLGTNPATGDLLSANGGWSNGVKGSTVSIIHAPAVTDPSDVNIAELGEDVVFTTEVTGIKPSSGKLQWQSSENGTDWTDIEGATGDELLVEQTIESDLVLSYRVSWSDPFWGASGSSAAVRIIAPAPVDPPTVTPPTVEPPVVDPPKGPVCTPARKSPVFADVALTQKFYTEIDWMHCMKLSTGTRQPPAKPLYKPMDNLSREAMAAFMFRLEAPKNYTAPKVSPFADVKPGDAFYTQIAWMWEAKLSTGTAQASGKPLFKPKESLSREAMAAFIYRLESPKKYTAPKVSPMADMKPGMKFYKEISWMYSEKLTTGNKVGNTKEFWPKNKLSREAMAAFIYRLVTDYRA
ncbi:DNA-binding beta-propeller fold protein YncE [Leucobacter luti]|uniref:YncE family protein n=1 Tax=Leucobacter luti TaxID=340320 RepID=UPI00105121DA|nr:PQQ-binding-like beta-propeller repeat protein [Leucobacter luti]MCW2289615.1 outer membrane protein assembly factor BamB [Leucobacter luti]TCK37787.1 DNA-binding beta-propeller fold protein YncE [Leucobacter luti]